MERKDGKSIISDFGFRISDFPSTIPRHGTEQSRSPEVPGIPIRRESACLASSQEARWETDLLEVRSVSPERGWVYSKLIRVGRIPNSEFRIPHSNPTYSPQELEVSQTLTRSSSRPAGIS